MAQGDKLVTLDGLKAVFDESGAAETTYNLYTIKGYKNCYINEDGTETGTNAARITTGYIPVDPAKDYIFSIDGESGLAALVFAWYNADKVYISRNNQTSVARAYTASLKKHDAEDSSTRPEGAVFVRIGFQKTGAGFVEHPENALAWHPMLREEGTSGIYVPKHTGKDLFARGRLDSLEGSVNGRFAGKRISILGDSISTFAGNDAQDAADGHKIADGVYTYAGNHCRYPNDSVTSAEQTYWMKLIQSLGMVLGVNESWAGSRVSWGGGESGDYGADIYMGSPTRIGHLGANGTPDIILVNAGTNDIGRRVDVGTFNTEDPRDYSDETIAGLNVRNFADAYRAMLIRLQKAYPLARIVVMLPNYTTSYYDPTSADEYLEMIKTECDYFGIPWADMRTVGVTMFNTGTYFSDGIHPNPAGMELLFEKIEKFFRYTL